MKLAPQKLEGWCYRTEVRTIKTDGRAGDSV